MKYTQKREVNTLTITFKADAAEWQEFDKKAYEQNKGKYNVPGFRKGHVPKSVLENRYGKGLFYEDALYLAAQEYYTQFLDKNSKVTPVSRPELEDKSVKIDDKGVTFAVVVTLRPEVTLGEYKGLTVEKTQPQQVTDADVDAEIQRLRERNARYIEVTDRPVQEGDEVNLDYCGKIDGVAFEGGTAQKQTLVIGSHTFIPGFEEQIVGMNLEETKDIQVTFPEDYHAEDLKGKNAVFTCTVHGISVKQLPEIDDEFAKDASEFSTMEEFKADIRKTLQAKNDKLAADQDESKLVETIVENAKMEIPDVMIEEQIDDYVQDFRYQLSYQGLSLENYFKYTNSDLQQLRSNYRERAQKAVRTRLVFEEIVKAEKIKATAKKVDAKIKQYAETIGKSFDEVKAGLQEQEKYYFENQVITEALMELIKSQNTIA
ncbi:MAG TPA: trigger factor [Candidatus Fimimonas merdipullorum]|uniref:Trigger factor n=1 Tax=Candidatus Fimimonas merdipullorum TaxID=2840822 RepID=A0A9D1SPN7_9BACT|nr:trigger factor [Candidatus Fimimonas merdipullorum]